jgi:hypothetical protein
MHQILHRFFILQDDFFQKYMHIYWHQLAFSGSFQGHEAMHIMQPQSQYSIMLRYYKHIFIFFYLNTTENLYFRDPFKKGFKMSYRFKKMNCFQIKQQMNISVTRDHAHVYWTPSLWCNEPYILVKMRRFNLTWWGS